MTPTPGTDTYLSLFRPTTGNLPWTTAVLRPGR